MTQGSLPTRRTSRPSPRAGLVTCALLLAGALEAAAVTIDHFVSMDYYVEPGATVLLRWRTTGADTLRIDNGVGDVTPNTKNGIHSQFHNLRITCVE